MPTATIDKRTKQGRAAAMSAKAAHNRLATAHAHYMLDGYNDAYRVWLTGDPGDVFDVVPVDDFPLSFVQKYPTLFIEGYPEDDNGEINCERCKALRD